MASREAGTGKRKQLEAGGVKSGGGKQQWDIGIQAATTGHTALERGQSSLPSGQAGRWRKPMLDQMQCSPGFEHPADFAQGGSLVGNTAKCPRHEDGIGMMVIAGQMGRVATKVFDPGMTTVNARTGRFECAGSRFDRQDFLHFLRKVGEIQSGAEANFNDPASQTQHDLAAKVEEFPPRQQSVGQKRKYVISINCHYRKRVKLTWRVASALDVLATITMNPLHPEDSFSP